MIFDCIVLNRDLMGQTYNPVMCFFFFLVIDKITYATYNWKT